MSRFCRIRDEHEPNPLHEPLPVPTGPAMVRGTIALAMGAVACSSDDGGVQTPTDGGGGTGGALVAPMYAPGGAGGALVAPMAPPAGAGGALIAPMPPMPPMLAPSYCGAIQCAPFEYCCDPLAETCSVAGVCQPARDAGADGG